MNDSLTEKPIRYLIPRILLLGLLLLAYMVLREFLVTIAWALIIAYVMWPPYHWLKSRMKNQATASAAVMTSLIAIIILSTLYGLVDMLQAELKVAYQMLADSLTGDDLQLPDFIRGLPWVGDHLQQNLDRFREDKASIARHLIEWSRQGLGEFAKFLGGVGDYVMRLAVVLVTLFFCFRDGETAVGQLREGLVSFLGKYQDVYIHAAADTIRAVVYGLVLAALAQGILAGLGYAVAGVKAPVLFASVTALLALVPMGATLVWIPLALGLIFTDRYWPGIGLLLWGFFVVSTVDNVIRPIVISGTSHVPFLVVMFGILGGLLAFGAIGLFLGPVILAVLLSVWECWLKLQAQEGRNI
jgi:Ca2+-transporting ATPase